ncbi:MAG: hypothetical protein IT383_07485 [Deltaproteobacteria bacterium]|nr:hypothetical protein [Deltaproteobacteria bacterium]
MHALVPWLLMVPFAAPAAGAEEPRWALTVELPRTVQIGGVGLLSVVSRSTFLLRGSLDDAQVQRCELYADSPLARAVAAPVRDRDTRLRFTAAGPARVDDAASLMPAEPVRFSLVVPMVGTFEVIATVAGRLALEGRRQRDALAGSAVVHDSRERIDGPAFFDMSFPDGGPVHGSFRVVPTGARSCAELIAEGRRGGGR